MQHGDSRSRPLAPALPAIGPCAEPRQQPRTDSNPHSLPSPPQATSPTPTSPSLPTPWPPCWQACWAAPVNAASSTLMQCWHAPGAVPPAPAARPTLPYTCPAAPIPRAAAIVCYVESATGMREGGRTGFAAVVTAILFFAASFLSPLFGQIPSVRLGCLRRDACCTAASIPLPPALSPHPPSAAPRCPGPPADRHLAHPGARGRPHLCLCRGGAQLGGHVGCGGRAAGRGGGRCHSGRASGPGPGAHPTPPTLHPSAPRTAAQTPSWRWSPSPSCPSPPTSPTVSALKRLNESGR